MIVVRESSANDALGKFSSHAHEFSDDFYVVTYGQVT